MAYTSLAKGFSKENNLEIARDTLIKALRLNPKDLEVILLKLCQVYSKLGDHLMASRMAKRAIILLSTNIVN